MFVMLGDSLEKMRHDAPNDPDSAFTSDMLIQIGIRRANGALELHPPISPPNPAVHDKDEKPIYTCKHWDKTTRLCTVYDQRPNLCRAYPNNKPCEWELQGCTVGCTVL
jgi:Fe-S-cluster containining protein